MKRYRLDKNAFKAHSVAEAASHYLYWQKQSAEERLKAAMYLNSVAFDYDLNNPPRMDKTIFRRRKRR